MPGAAPCPAATTSPKKRRTRPTRISSSTSRGRIQNTPRKSSSRRRPGPTWQGSNCRRVDTGLRRYDGDRSIIDASEEPSRRAYWRGDDPSCGRLLCLYDDIGAALERPGRNATHRRASLRRRRGSRPCDDRLRADRPKGKGVADRMAPERRSPAAALADHVEQCLTLLDIDGV